MSYALSASDEYTADRGATYVGTDYWMKDPNASSAPSSDTTDESAASEAPAPGGGGAPSSAASSGGAPLSGLGASTYLAIGLVAVAAGAWYALK